MLEEGTPRKLAVISSSDGRNISIKGDGTNIFNTSGGSGGFYELDTSSVQYNMLTGEISRYKEAGPV